MWSIHSCFQRYKNCNKSTNKSGYQYAIVRVVSDTGKFDRAWPNYRTRVALVRRLSAYRRLQTWSDSPPVSTKHSSQVPHRLLQLNISCHFGDCIPLLILSLIHVSRCPMLAFYRTLPVVAGSALPTADYDAASSPHFRSTTVLGCRSDGLEQSDRLSL